MSLSDSPRIQIVLAALLLSSAGVAIKACGFNSWQVASFRAGAAALTLLLVMPRLRRELNLRTLAVGAAYGATAITFVLANKLTTSANAIFIQSSAPLYICLLGPLLLREPLRLRDLWLMLSMGCGLGLFFLGEASPTHTAPDPLAGNLFGGLSGIFWALTILGIRWLSMTGGREGASGPAAVMWGCLLAFLATLPMALPVTGARGIDWSIVFYLGAFTMAVVFIMVSSAAKRLTALEAGLLLLIEPTLNPIWTWLVLGERPGPLALLGGGFILGATLVNAWWTARERCRVGAAV